MSSECTKEESPQEVMKPEDVDDTKPIPMNEVTNTIDLVAMAYKANSKAHHKGISSEEMVKNYTDWANNYDEDLCPGTYNGPEIIRDAMNKFYTCPKIRAVLKIIDIAAGTGRVGDELFQQGFKTIDALEPSKGMLNVLEGRGVYQTKYQTLIGNGAIEEIPSNKYDCLVTSGGMGEGHIPVCAIDEMIRMVRSGGTIFIVMREEYLSYVEEYTGKLEPYMDTLEKKGLWKKILSVQIGPQLFDLKPFKVIMLSLYGPYGCLVKISRTIVPSYSFNLNGVLYNYEVSS